MCVLHRDQDTVADCTSLVSHLGVTFCNSSCRSSADGCASPNFQRGFPQTPSCVFLKVTLSTRELVPSQKPDFPSSGCYSGDRRESCRNKRNRGLAWWKASTGKGRAKETSCVTLRVADLSPLAIKSLSFCTHSFTQ